MLSSWERLWIEAFEELEENIEAQLRGAKSYLENLSKLAKLGCSDVESQVLAENTNPIRDVIATTPLSKVPRIVLAAFAYAAQLVWLDDHADDSKGKYVNAINRRIESAKHGKARMAISIILMMAGEASSIKKIPPSQN